MRFIVTLLLAALLFAAHPPSVIAKSNESTVVLGLSLGSATVAGARKAALAAGARETAFAVSAITQGGLLTFRGDFGLEGLQQTTLIFDSSGKLVAALLELGKHRYTAVLAALKGKYRLENEVKPFVGNRSARLRSGDVKIVAESPHMSFEMSVTYARDVFWHQLADYQARQADAKRKAESARL